MFTYDIAVFLLGKMIDNLRLSATNALEACNLAEKLMQVKPVPCVIGSNGTSRVVEWSGLEFQAKRVIR